MIVCLCRGASDRDVNRAIERGASSIAELQRCGIGTECGSCHNLLRLMLAEGHGVPALAGMPPAEAGAPPEAESPAPSA